MTYSTCNTLLSNTTVCAFEAHGMATGMLCNDNKADANRWLSELSTHTGQLPNEQTTDLLVELFKTTREILTQNEFAYALFLPDDDTALQERLVALVAWCQGFLHGISINHATQNDSAQTREIIKDIIEFTKLDTDSEGDEDDEAALAEIIEYLRSSVLLLHGELS